MAMFRLRAELHAAPDHDRPAILAARQMAPDHVRALGAAVGLRLTGRDFVELRTRAEDAVRRTGLDLGDAVDEVLISAGVAMRSAAADYLARRCYEGGEALAARAFNADPRFADGRSPTASDWRTLILKCWRLLPIMRPAELADLLAARRSDALASDRVLANVA